MCGIAGAVFWDSPSGLDPLPVVRRMTDALAHRGPDGEGVVRCLVPGATAEAGPAAVLGHKRLAIIDLTPRAAQPMVSAQTPVWITFNGEIYNFKSLRRELEAVGRRFRSDSDTEVVLQGYECWGDRVVERLQGMFAFAIWDGRTGRLVVARDRLGIKPLYVHQARGYVLFASEIRALLASDLVPRKLDRVALDQYLASQTVSPPRTLVGSVRMTEPGCIVTSVVGGRPAKRRYWDLLDSASREAKVATDAESRTRVRELLDESTRLHLVADVPVGVFLSGGIDSTAVAALVRRTGRTPRTFCVSFPGTPFDEGPVARSVAAALGAEHIEIPLAESEFCGQLPGALAGVDHPSADGINTNVVSRAVRATGIKVALSGLGGDELFGGYPSFARLRRIAGSAQAWRWSPAVVRRLAAATVRGIGGSSVGASKASALLETGGTLPHAYPLLRQLFTPASRIELIGRTFVEAAALDGDPGVELMEAAMARHPDAGMTSLVSYAEARLYMHDVLLRDTDQMSMAHGLEVRVPLLDHRLAEYVMGLRDAAKRPKGVAKRLLLDSLAGEIPSQALNRPKRGFVLPLDFWMRGELRPFCEHHLGPGGLGGRPLFRPAAVESLWRAFLANDGSTTWSRPWALVALNAWMERTGVGE